MKNIWLLFSFVLIIYSCENNRVYKSDLIFLVPPNSSVIIKTNSIEGLNSALKNNSLFDELSNYNQIKNLETQLQYLKHVKPTDELLIVLGKDANDSLQISIITKYHDNLFKLDSIPNHSVETLKSDNFEIAKTTIDQHIIYSAIHDSIFFASNDKSLVVSSFETPELDEELISIYNTINPNKSLSVLINSKNKSLTPSFFLSETLNGKQLTNYMLLDVDITNDHLKFNGISKAIDSTKSLINVFKNTVPQEIQLSKLCPIDADGFLSFTFDNYKTFNENLLKFRKKDTITSLIFDSASEIGVIYKGQSRAIIVRSLDAQIMNDLLLSQNEIETYREISIYPYDNPKLFSTYFSPFITYQKASKYANIDDFFIFSENDSFLKDIISTYQNNSGVSETNFYQSIMGDLSDEASLFFYANSSSLNQIFNSNFSDEKTLNIDSYKASAIQFVYDTDFAHVNAILKRNKSKAVSNSVSDDINVKLDADLLTNPHFVNNHTNSQMEIVVQDISNNLYLISKDGKVLWKKQLDSKILGKIEQIDTYKNGRLQLVFATEKRLYLLDRNGKDVTGFPLKFNDQITQPLSVFDYDKNKDYRLMVTQGKSILLYDKNGKTVGGFNYKKAENTINTQPTHFRIGRKDYIVFTQGKELEILDRVGKTRINVKNNISFSENDIYLYNNKFTTTNTKGELIQIDENGKLTVTNLNLAEKHSLATTSKTLVTLSDNILKIKSNTVELEFGDYTSPKIFYLNDKIYVSVTDLQTKKVYLFDSYGKLIDNFPVYGNSTIELDNIDKEKSLEFLTKGDSNSIIIYNIN